MTEAELIKKLQILKQIQPRKGWVLLTKSRILGEEPKRNFASLLVSLLSTAGKVSPTVGILLPFRFLNFKNYKPVLVTIASLFILISGAFIFAQNSLPGDLFYPIKKITERSQKPFVPEKEFNIKIVNNRLDDLASVAQSNSTKNLAPAINEYKASVSEVAKNLAKDETKKNPNELKKIVKEVQSIEKKTAEMESLGMVIGENIELDSALVELIKLQVQDLEKRTLTQEQIKSIGDIKADIEAGKYSDALEKILEINQ